MFFAGIRPAINVGLSVSRVGGSAQVKAMRQVAGTMRMDMAQFRELEAFAQFGSDLDKSTQAQLNRGYKLVEILKQPQYQPLSMEKQVLILYAGTQGYCDDIPTEEVANYESQLYEFMESRQAEIMAEIGEKKELTDDLKAKMNKALEEFGTMFKATLN